MKVQFLNWVSKDIQEHDKSAAFHIFGFGRTVDPLGSVMPESICVVFKYFKPYFFFLAEDESITMEKIVDNIHKEFMKLEFSFKKKAPSFIRQKCIEMGLPNFLPQFDKEMLSTEEIWSHIFMGKGFENFKKRRFIKVFFQSQRAFRFFQKFIPFCCKDHTIYEGNINPMLKMFHDQNFSPSSWLDFDDKIMVERNEASKFTKAKKEFLVYYSSFHRQKIKPISEDNSLWFKLCSFDIECDSSHGDYPLSKKQYGKFIREIKTYLRDIKKKVLEDIIFMEQLVSYINQCVCGQSVDKENPFSRIYLKKVAKVERKTIYSQGVEETRYTSPFDGEIISCIRKCFSSQDFSNLESLMEAIWGAVHGDPIIQIGNIVEFPKGVYHKRIFCLGETEIQEAAADTVVVSCETESKLISEWCRWLEQEDPDILMGYNIYNFDNEYIWNRAEEVGVLSSFGMLSRIDKEEVRLVDMTKGTGKYFTTHGREMIDLMDFVKKNYSLDSYSLDNVSARFIRGRIQAVEGNQVRVASRPIGLQPNDFFKIYVNNGIYEEKFEWAGRTKFKIKQIVENTIITTDELSIDSEFIHEWCLSKDDILPKQIFEFQKGSKFDRGLIAKYCIQDCMLCHYIFQKLEVLINSMAMSNVCYVPFGYLFLRGQSVKIFSLIAKQCSDENYRIPVLDHNTTTQQELDEEDSSGPGGDSYEGALVLDPLVGIYINEPVSVNDFNSLYPSCGIAENISPDTHVLNPEFMNIPGIEYNTITFDELEYRQVVGVSGRIKKNKEAVRVGSRTCVFAVFPQEKKGILPKIWMMLLNQRKMTRKRMESEKDPFRKTLLDGLQLAFKTTANSMYGIFGFRKSPLYYQDVAASITACGRKNLTLAKDFIEKNYPGSKIIYGDTDSLFVSYPSTKENELEKIYESIDIATEAGDRVSTLLKRPHNLGFEKCVSPFILMARKRYTGLYYTSKSPKKYMNTMGFALKRRDNAVIVKEIVGNAIKKILFEKDIEGSVAYVQSSIMDMLHGKYPIEKFIVTKTLRGSYACPEQISHYVLSQKMAERDPGNKPKVGDRIPFVFIETKNPNAKQTERIESPSYIMDHRCKIDYMYYLTNQLMNPLTQVYSLVYKENTEKVVFSTLLRCAYQMHHNMPSLSLFFPSRSSESCIAEKRKQEAVDLAVNSTGTVVIAGKKKKKGDVVPEVKITSFFRPAVSPGENDK